MPFRYDSDRVLLSNTCKFMDMASLLFLQLLFAARAAAFCPHQRARGGCQLCTRRAVDARHKRSVILHAVEQSQSAEPRQTVAAAVDAQNGHAAAKSERRAKKKPPQKKDSRARNAGKVAAAIIALAATAPVPTTLFAWHPALAALSLPLAAAAGVVVAGPQPVFYPTITPSPRLRHRRDVTTQAAPPPRSAPRARTAARRSSGASSCILC